MANVKPDNITTLTNKREPMTAPNGTESVSKRPRHDSGPRNIIEILLYTEKGNVLLALGGMYTVSMSVGFTILYILVSLPLALGLIGVYTVFLAVFINFRSPDKRTERLSYAMFIGLPYVFTIFGVAIYEIIG